ncbi:MAG TPA: right-handed parallel beta-helix repeat-containing protein [Kiritimatiellia bacterium]|nr:right-handed parallel beta-helix repeat-containing protein [Kiritimatiellia bacterium]HMO98132.1 right-handed parallel beta-helix repeat-containing protein [Kiritimatiellia bacterium]
MGRAWLGAWIITGWIFSSLGASYYVAPDGLDSHPGTSTNLPLRTIQRALNLVAPGDAIYVRGGVYREHLTNRTHGTASQPILIAAYSNETPLIKGSRIVTNWSLHTGSVWKTTGWTNRSQQVFVNGEWLQQIGPAVNPFIEPLGFNQNDMIPGSFFHDRTNSILYIQPSFPVDPNLQTVEASVGDDLFLFAIGRHYLVRGLHFQHSNVLGQWPGILVGSHTRLVDCSITWMNYIGVLLGSYSVLENCLVAHNGGSGVHADFSTNVVIMSNTINSNNLRGVDASMIASGIKLYASSGFQVVSNRLDGNLSNGIWADFCRDDSPKLIHANTVVNTRGHPRRPDNVAVALFIEVSRRVMAANNLLIGNELIGIQVAESDYIDVVNNTVAFNRGIASLHGRTMSRWMPATHQETNNTVWASLTHNRLVNNLVFGGQTEHDLFWPLPSTNVIMRIEDNTINGNLYFRENQLSRFYTDRLYTNLAALSAATGMESDGFNQDPRLASPDTGDFRLSAFSVAIDAGFVDLPPDMPSGDHEGNPRVLFDRVDIGCFEFDGSAGAIAPSVTITTACGWVAYDAFEVRGVNNANVVGDLWADVVALPSTVTTRYPVVRLSSTQWRVADFTPEPLVAHEITITATNWNGTPAYDTCTLQRGGIGTGRPWVGITNAPDADIIESFFTLSGTQNVHVAGFLPWVCLYAGEVVASGAVSAAGASWSAAITGMRTGQNYIVISVTNAWGVFHSVTSRIHSGETPIHYVSTNSPNPLYPYTSWETAAHVIMDAVDAASDGDTVLVGPGLYQEGGRDHLFGFSRVILDKGITLESSEGPEVTTIWGHRPGGPVSVRGVLMVHTQAIIRGFTIRNGRVQGFPVERSYGGGLLANDMARIERCVFTGNTATPNGKGGGAALWYAQGTITDCVFHDNQAFSGGGLAILWGTNAVAHRLLAFNNHALNNGGGFVVDNCSRFSSAVAWSNRAEIMGGGIALGNNAIIRNVTVERNSAPEGGAFALVGAEASIISSIAWSNTPPGIKAVSNHLVHTVRQSILPHALPAHWSVIQVLNVNPQYENAAAGNFRLTANSPALDMGQTLSWLRDTPDMDGNARVAGPFVDIGAYEFWRKIWIESLMNGYIAGATNPLNIRLIWAADRQLAVSNVTVTLPSGWELIGASRAGESIPINGNQILPTQPLLLGDAFITALIRVDPGATHARTVTAAVAATLIKGSETFAWSGAAAPLVVNHYKWLNAQPSGSGQMTTTLPNGWTIHNQMVTITAQADPGWRFRGWIGDTHNAITNANGSINVLMNRDRNVQADFVQLVTLTVESDRAGVLPPPMTYVMDRGEIMALSARAVVTNEGRTHVVADWVGSGRLPVRGTARAFTVLMDEDTSIAWRWCALEARHASRGARVQGDVRSTILVTITYETSGVLDRIWYKPVLPDGASVVAVRGAHAPAMHPGGAILLLEQLDSGEASFEMDILWPPDTRGPVAIQATVGVNAFHDEPEQSW